MSAEHGYGWRRSNPDYRDLLTSAAHDLITNLPPRASVRDQFPPIVDQSSLGACTANGETSQYSFDEIKQTGHFVQLSRLFLYWAERERENSIESDAGADPRDGMKSLKKYGVPPETLWPYDISKFRATPPPDAFKAAKARQVVSYRRVPQTLAQIKAVIAGGYPVGLGFTVYESFESLAVAKTGLVPMPSGKEAVLGGHYTVMTGYRDDMQRFEVANSWGVDWGDHGFFYMPYSYVVDANLAGDLWLIRKVEAPAS